jgi:hypothetical protein
LPRGRSLCALLERADEIGELLLRHEPALPDPNGRQLASADQLIDGRAANAKAARNSTDVEELDRVFHGGTSTCEGASKPKGIRRPRVDGPCRPRRAERSPQTIAASPGIRGHPCYGLDVSGQRLLSVVCAACERAFEGQASRLAVLGTLRGAPCLLLPGEQRGRQHYGTRLFTLPRNVTPLDDDYERVAPLLGDPCRVGELIVALMGVAPALRALLMPLPETDVAEVLGTSLATSSDGEVRATRRVWHALTAGLSVELACSHRHRLVLSVERVQDLVVEALSRGCEGLSRLPVRPERTSVAA